MIARAAQFTAAEVERAVGGELFGAPDRLFRGVSSDTRDALTGCLFVALVGEKHDAHEFLPAAISAGAAGLLVEEDRFGKVKDSLPKGDYAVIAVDDSLFGLGELARFHRQRRAVPVIALTGSNGKTSTKELLAAIAGAPEEVLKTEGNLNNLIGVPFTLLGLLPAHKIAIVEMGMNTPGEIARYAEIASPAVGLITNVGPAHIGELGSMEAIASAKGELFQGLDPADGVAVVNADDPFVALVYARSRVKHRRTFGRAAGVDVRLVSREPILDPDGLDKGQRIELEVDGKKLRATIPFAGEHNALNAAAAVAAATARPDLLPIDLERISAGLPMARAVGRRLAFEKVGPYLMVDDCYNANSASMLAALETVSERANQTGRRLVAVLGEMRELGVFGPEEHKRVGKALLERNVPLVAVLGALAGPIASAATGPGVDARHEADDFEALWAWLKARLRPNDLILIKGSRGAKMERFVERLRSEA